MVSHKTISKKALKISKPSLKAKASSSWCEYMLWNISPVLNETTGVTRTKTLMTLRTISKKLGKTVQRMHKSENVDIQFGSNMAIGCKLNQSAGKYVNYEASSPEVFNAIINSVFDTETSFVSAITQKDQRMEKKSEDDAIRLCYEYFESAQYSLEIKPSFNPTTSQTHLKVFEKVKSRLTSVKCQLEDLRHLEGVSLEKVIVNEQKSNQKYYAPILTTNAAEINGLSLEIFRDSEYATNTSVKRLNCRFAMDALSIADYKGIYKNLSSNFPNLKTVNLDTNTISIPSGDDDEEIYIEDYLQSIIENLRAIRTAATVKTAVKLLLTLEKDELEIKHLLYEILAVEFEKFEVQRNFWSFESDLFYVNIEFIC